MRVESGLFYTVSLTFTVESNYSKALFTFVPVAFVGRLSPPFPPIPSSYIAKMTRSGTNQQIQTILLLLLREFVTEICFDYFKAKELVRLPCSICGKHCHSYSMCITLL